jgi:hypothetical protein
VDGILRNRWTISPEYALSGVDGNIGLWIRSRTTKTPTRLEMAFAMIMAFF